MLFGQKGTVVLCYHFNNPLTSPLHLTIFSISIFIVSREFNSVNEKNQSYFTQTKSGCSRADRLVPVHFLILSYFVQKKSCHFDNSFRNVPAATLITSRQRSGCSRADRPAINSVLSHPYFAQKKNRIERFFLICSGSYLLSRAVSHQVSSALQSLTTVFGMGTGVTSVLSPPDKLTMQILNSIGWFLPFILLRKTI